MTRPLALPILAAWRQPVPYDHLCAVWCTRCLAWHTHGAGDGPRVPHCPQDQGFNAAPRSEYFVRIVGDASIGGIDTGEWPPRSPAELGLTT